MDLTTLTVVIVGVLLTAFLAVFGWHLNATINLMGAFRDVINELKTLNAMIGQRDESQKLTCKIHNEQTLDLKRRLDLEIRKINHSIDNLNRELNEHINEYNHITR
jgi:hypothetical protein